MQLKSKPNQQFSSIRAALTAATCTVLASPVTAAEPEQEITTNPWEVDSALLYYSEQERISVIEPALIASQEQPDGSRLTLSVAADTMTGASPTGAAPTDSVTTITSPSGNATTTIAPGNTPMNSFRDRRLSLGIGYLRPLTRILRNTLGINLSKEADYSSIGVTESIEVDFNNRLTTLTTSLGVRNDYVAPIGGTPTRLGHNDTAPRSDEVSGLLEGERKQVTEMMVGVTQILSRRLLTQLNYSHSLHNGYLQDPYKVVSVVDSGGRRLNDIHESRPGRRTTQSVYWKLAAHLPQDILQLSYRYFWDDWNINSHTTELRYRFALSPESYLQPHLRHYSQSSADFFVHSILDGTSVTHASADLRLGEMQSNTVGVKYGTQIGTLWRIFTEGELALSIEQMKQQGESHPSSAIGIQSSYDLYPTLRATIIQFQFSFNFE